MIGRALNGRYELVEILGVGGMATVWRGHDRVLGRSVAVKVLNGGLADDPRFAERFGREAQHAAMLAHPRIVMVFDSGVDQGSPYIVMELVNGRPLSQLIVGDGQLPPAGLPVERAVGVAAAVCEALEVAHAAGLVHRDIKPGNIMITDDGGVKVVDFGIARASSSGSQLTQTATVLGTAAYLSPEQATAAEIDGRADLYALGCVLVEMLTGAPPFTADAPVAIAFKHVSEQPTPVSVRRPGIPPALDAAVLRLLAKNPADRPADAARARAELLAAVPATAAPDRTAELLATTQVFAPLTPPLTPPPAHPPAAATTALPHLPFTEQQRTSLLPPVQPPGPAYEPPQPPVPERRRRPLVLAGVGLAVAGGVAAVAAFAFSSPGGDTKGGTPATQAAGPAAGPSPSVSPSASPSSSASPSPSASPKAGSAGLLTALRAAIEQASFNKEHGAQGDLLGLMDDAAAALADRQPQRADQSLRNAQRLIKDLVKKHAVDGGAAQNWQNRINAVLATLHAAQQLPGRGQQSSSSSSSSSDPAGNLLDWLNGSGSNSTDSNDGN
ncbi:protein kinase domain-containing protein [Kitasatospora sp. McL0602]|uniref:protein kinase domain-containing protein n=1 Tax=Kitasatospora sp. McL0602 TaxID=3439530 RepID=UPI003F8CD618